MIGEYLNNEITDNDYLEFYRHIINCQACKEELTIQYFVKVGLDETEEPEDLDLPKNLDRLLYNRFMSIVNKRSRRFGLLILLVGFFVFLILFILF